MAKAIISTAKSTKRKSGVLRHVAFYPKDCCLDLRELRAVH